MCASASCSVRNTAVLRCAADKITIDSKAHHTVPVGAVFSSMLAETVVACIRDVMLR